MSAMLNDDPAGASARRYYGKYPAVVVADTPADAARLAKVKVRVFGILEEDPDGEPRPIEVLARPCLPPGFFFVPPEGTHVWVEFAAGDINTPIWSGVWYADGEPPDTADGEDPGADMVVIRDKHDNVVTLKNGSVTIAIGGRGRINLGGAEVSELSGLLMNSQEVITYLTTHQHGPGNTAAATGAPIGMPRPIDDWFTSVTRAK